MLAGEEDIDRNRNGYKIGLYFSLVVLLLIVAWSILSELRWILFEASGWRPDYDYWVLVLVGVMAAFGFVAFTLGQYSKKLSKECAMLGGNIHLEERHLVFVWSLIIGTVLGMGFWDIVTIVHLAMDLGFFAIWNIPVTVYDFGVWQLIIPVWGLVIIGIVKMGAVIVFMAIALKNINRGTICDLARFDSKAILG